jgi:hypothetical protein
MSNLVNIAKIKIQYLHHSINAKQQNMDAAIEQSVQAWLNGNYDEETKNEIKKLSPKTKLTCSFSID